MAIDLNDAGPQEGDAPQEKLPERVPGDDLTAPFANAYYVVAGDGIARIAFGETVVSDYTRYHTALVLPIPEAKGLAELILRLIKEAADEGKKPEGEPNAG